MNIVFHADLSQLRRAPAERPVLGAAAGRGHRRHRPRPGADGAAVGRVADRLGLRHQRAAARGRRGDGDARSCTTWSATTRSPVTMRVDVAVGQQQAVRRRATPRAACSAWATPCHRHPPSNGLGSNTSIAGRLQPRLEARARARRARPAPALLRHLRRRARADRQADRAAREQEHRGVRADLRRRSACSTRATPSR